MALVLIVQGFINEGICLRNGYEVPIYAAGEHYCFGKDGEPVVISIAELRQ